jgi:thioredoxin reductase
VGTLALLTEEAEKLDRLDVRGPEPVRHPGVELRDLAGCEHEVVFAEYESKPTVEDVEPLVPLVCLRIGLGPVASWRDHELVRLDAARPPGQRQHRHAVPIYRPKVDARIAGRGCVNQLVEGDAVCPGEREQLLERGPATAGLESGQGADRDAGRRGQVGQSGLAFAPQGTQPWADGVERLVEVVHLPSLPDRQSRLPELGAPRTLVVEVVIMTDHVKDGYDVLVVGGGAAGLSGALMLARARRSVAVIDAGEPRNAPATAVHGLLGLDGTPPSELLERGRAEVRGYGGEVIPGEVATVARDDDGFAVALADGRTTRARRLLVATGLVDELPDIPGLRDRWGHDVVHCPYCHGWEVRDRAIGVLATGPRSVHQALLFRQWSDDVTYLTHTADGLSDDDAERMAARGIAVVEGEVASVEVVDDRLVGVRLRDGTLIDREVLAVSARMVARGGFLADLGLRPVEHAGFDERIPADATGRTDVPGVWVAGNVTDLSAQVGAAAAGGAMAGAQINADLVEDDTERAMAARRAA